MTKRIDQLTEHPKNTVNPLSMLSVLPLRDSTLSTDNTTKIEVRDVAAFTRNILHYGADPTGVADSTAAIQAAIDSLLTLPIGGGIVFMPIGKYRITQLTMHMGVQLEGCGQGAGYRGTTLIQDNGVDSSAIIMDSEIQGSGNTGYAHGVGFRNFRLLKATPVTDTLGHGIFVNAHTGEGFHIEHVTVGNMPESGVRIIGSGPCTMHDVHPNANGAYGVALERNSSNSFQANFISMVSGDNNASGLIFVKNAHAYLNGIKCEKTVAGRNEAAVVISGSGTAECTFINNISFGATNAAGAPQAFVKLIGGMCSVYLNQPNLLLATTPPADYILDNVSNLGSHNVHVVYDGHLVSCHYSARANGGHGQEVFRVNDAGCLMLIGFDPIRSVGMVGFGVTNGAGDGSVTPMQANAKGTQANAPASMTVNKWVRMTVNGVDGWAPFFV